MKAFLLSLVALVVISVASNQILLRSGFFSAAKATSSSNVRLSE